MKLLKRSQYGKIQYKRRGISEPSGKDKSFSQPLWALLTLTDVYPSFLIAYTSMTYWPTGFHQSVRAWRFGREGVFLVHSALCVKEKDNDMAIISIPHITDHIKKYNSSLSFYQRQDILAENAVLSDYSTSCLINVIGRPESIKLRKQAATLNKTVFWKWNILLVCWWFFLRIMMAHSKIVFCAQFCFAFLI